MEILPVRHLQKAGINVILFRGSERNKRRGFHNLYVFRQRLDRELNAGVPYDLATLSSAHG